MEQIANDYLIDRNNREILDIKNNSNNQELIQKLINENEKLKKIDIKHEEKNNSHLNKIFDKITKNIENQEWKKLPLFIRKSKINEFIIKKIESKHQNDVINLINTSKKIKITDYEYNRETFSLDNIKCLKLENNKYII